MPRGLANTESPGSVYIPRFLPAPQKNLKATLVGGENGEALPASDRGDVGDQGDHYQGARLKNLFSNVP